MLIALRLGGGVPAFAQNDTEIFTPETIFATGDIRLTGIDGERGWLDGGLGKARYGSDGAFRIRPRAVEGDIVWQPRFTWSLSGTVVAIAQEGQEHAVDLSEAFLSFKPLLGGQTKVSTRLGLVWPPVSLEHGHGDWRVEETITPSAINGWIGEEVKVGALEGTVSTPVAGGRVALTGAIFGFNDTSGTLLAYRGWALHDQKATAFGMQPLPALGPVYTRISQALATRPVMEIDKRPGWFAGIAWSPSQAIELRALHYDNRGDPIAVTPSLQWGWRTTFDNLGAVVSLGRLTIKSQAMFGRTEMGYPVAGRIWIDTRFRSAFLLATHTIDGGSISARVEAFDTRSRGSVIDGRYSEDGWALTGAGRHEFGEHLSVLGEVVHIGSTRPDRASFGLNPHQRQTKVQIAFRAHL